LYQLLNIPATIVPTTIDVQHKIICKRFSQEKKRKKKGLLICVEIVENQTPSSQYLQIHGNTRCILCIPNPQQV
jgi:spore cortex formation protein SpoVR/YcgB (stage V sporulation)